MGDTVTTVQFVVPTDHALDFQRWGHERLAELTTPSPATDDDGQFEPTPANLAKHRDVWHSTPWGPDDTDRAEWLVGSLKHNPHAVLRLLCDRPGEWVPSPEIAEHVGLDGPKSVPSSFKSLAHRCRRADRRAMWDWEGDRGYMVKPEVADLFRPLLDD